MPKVESLQGKGGPEPMSSASQARAHFLGLHHANSSCGESGKGSREHKDKF